MGYAQVTQGELGAAIGLSANVINQRLQGRSEWSFNEVIAVERALGVKPGTLTDAARGQGIMTWLNSARPEGLEPPTF